MSTPEQIDNAFEQWLRNHRYTADAQTIVKIGQRVHENLERLGGIVAASSFERAYLELTASGAIRPFRGTVSEIAAAETPAGIPADVIHFIEHGSAFQQRLKYSNDPVFKKQFDTYANQQLKARVAAEESEESLTVEQYNSMPAIDVARKYRSSAAFKRGVDNLVKRNLI
jgi:hypothetical protein